MKKATIKKSTISGLLLTSILLTGCGGGGSTPTVATTPTTPTTPIVTVDEKTAITDAVDATPIAGANGGSTIQSNVSTAGLDVETTLVVDSPADYNTDMTTLSFKAAAGGSDVSFMHTDAVTTKITTPPYISTERVSVKRVLRDYKKTVDGGTFTALEGIIAYGDDNDEYLSLGRWNYTPANGTVEFGGWASGGDPFTQASLAGLSGTASYAGRAGGTVFNSDNTEEDIKGALALEANFNDNTIRGSISSITLDGVARPNSITLSSADIDIDVIGGSWEGNTSYTAQDNSELTGKWGGNFYGNGDSNTDHPEWVAGRYSLNSGDGTVVGGGFHGKKE